MAVSFVSLQISNSSNLLKNDFVADKTHSA